MEKELIFIVERYGYIGSTEIVLDTNDFKGKTHDDLKQIVKGMAMERDNWREYPYEDQDEYRVIEA